MHDLPVYWHEGMFLRPHHFQAADRYWAEQLYLTNRWSLPHHYGVRVLRFDAAALRDGLIRVEECEARLQGGHQCRLDGTLEAALGPFEEATRNRSHLGVWLGLAQLNRKGRNVARQADGTPLRYLPPASHEGVFDENTDQDPRTVEFRVYNVRLAFDPEAEYTRNHEYLQIARLVRHSPDAAWAWDDEFIPALLSHRASPPFAARLGELRDLIDQTLRVHAVQVHGEGLAVHSGPGGPDAARLLLLALCNRAWNRLNVLLDDEHGTHPLTLYLELCGLAGELALFRPSHRPLAPEPYRHHDLPRCFGGLLRDLRDQFRQLPGMGQPSGPGTLFTGGGTAPL